METANIDKLDYHLSKFSEFDVVDGCKPPCHTNTIVSTKLRVIKQDTNDQLGPNCCIPKNSDLGCF